MLLPSDVARLVLGYLQQEGLTDTSRAFIHESPNLREYAEHSSEDGAIPACVFSLFGKNLTTILNEYIAVKAKETCQENQIPAMMTSLWKKLDFTLNQIKSMQNSPAVQHIQRIKNGIQNMRRQRALASSQSPGTAGLTVSTPGHCVGSPVAVPQGMLGHSTPVCYTSQQTRPSTISLSQPGESTLQIIVPDHRIAPGPLSPARRKCDSPRRRGGSQYGPSRGTAVTSSLTVESHSQEAMTENLSQMVIENAREKILNDRSLQEKLAENINKILASESSPQTSKAVCSTIEQEQSIDEILGLQGEIHMTDDAIQDILQQTESDPAFQALFDLFDCGKSKMAEGGEPGDGSLSNSAQESDEPGLGESATDTGTGQQESTSGRETSTRKLRSTSLQVTKSKRKSCVPLSAGQLPLRTAPKRNATARGSRQTKKGTGSRSRVSSRGQLVVGVGSSSSDQLHNKPGQNTSSASLSDEAASMETDDPTSEMSEAIDTQLMPQTVDRESPQTKVTTKRTGKNILVSDEQGERTPSVGADASGSMSGAEKGSTAGMTGEGRLGAFDTTGQSTSEPSRHRSSHNTAMSDEASWQQLATNNIPLLDTCTQEMGGGPEQAPPSCSGSFSSKLSVSVAHTVHPSSTAPVSHPQTPEPDPSKIVALKIIISDDQEEQASDPALSQAVSSITGDRIPTIFLSSPAKSPPKVPPTPPSSVSPEETAQAVSSLQGAEAASTPATSMQLLHARPSSQETGFIKLLPANPPFGGTGGYFVLTDPAAAGDQPTGMMMLPGGGAQGSSPCMSHLLATPPRSRTVVPMAANVPQFDASFMTLSASSSIIISSPVQPMLHNMTVSMSVFGQDSTGKLTVIPNQMLALPGPTLVNQPVKIVSKPKLMPKDNVELGKTGISGSSPPSNISQSSEQLKSTTGVSPGHRRILCFDENAGQTRTTTRSTSTAASLGVKERTRAERPQPCALGSSNGKRRVNTIRLPEQSQTLGAKVSEKASVHQQQKETAKGMMTEMDAPISMSSNSATTQDAPVTSEPKKRPQSSPSTGNGMAAPSLTSPSQSPRPKLASTMTLEKRAAKMPEGATESSTSQDSPGVTANKENEVEGGRREAQHVAASSVESFASSALRPPAPVSLGKPLCKTSPLTKQAVEMLQDIQSQSPTSTPSRRKGTTCLDLPLPRTPGPGRMQEDSLDGLRTPSRLRQGREAEGTPRHLPPPATPDLPSCSPASEAGSENSINMAAHTLMILSRAARTGGPLKDSLRQEEAGAAKSSASSSKKRKHTELSPAAKKELQLSSSSGSKKKAQKRKKLLDSFPRDLDVDKFLSSLHYDE
uniref:Protein NPAT C-terminal domain-containing protein n=1 Tax=Electrophorus electricus TaxID=8005 RepID=A0AAY5EXZ8_ELEEL